MTVPPITTRSSKGSPLTAAEGDANLTTLRDAINGLFALLGVALKSDGSIKDAAVATAAIVDRAVTNAKLAFDSAFYAADSGAADALVVTFSPAPSAYAAGMRLLVRVANTNTTVTTINVNSLGVKTIKKNGSTDLAAGDIIAGQIIDLAYDSVSGTFQMANTLPNVTTPWATGVVFQQFTPNTTALSSIPQKIADCALTLPAGKTWVGIKVVFSGFLNGTTGSVKGIEFETNPIRHSGTGLALVTDRIPGGVFANNSDDAVLVHFTAEGVPTGYTGVSLALEIYAKYPSSASAGDDTSRRNGYAIGYYR